MLTLLRLKPFGYCSDWEMECETVRLVLHYEEVAHRFKFFRRGSWPARDELLASVCQGLGLAPGTSLRFFDEDDDQVLLNSCVRSGTVLRVVVVGTLPRMNDDTSSSDEDPEPHMVEEIPPMPTRPVPIPELEEDDIVLPDEPEPAS